eukprot:2425114-Prymnesium_polylepis.1
MFVRRKHWAEKPSVDTLVGALVDAPHEAARLRRGRLQAIGTEACVTVRAFVQGPSCQGPSCCAGHARRLARGVRARVTGRRHPRTPRAQPPKLPEHAKLCPRERTL